MKEKYHLSTIILENCSLFHINDHSRELIQNLHGAIAFHGQLYHNMLNLNYDHQALAHLFSQKTFTDEIRLGQRNISTNTFEGIYNLTKISSLHVFFSTLHDCELLCLFASKECWLLCTFPAICLE